MTTKFDRERSRTITRMWREGTPFDAIVEYIGIGPDEVAAVLFRAIQPMGFVNPYGRTLGDVMRDEKKAREALKLEISATRLSDLLPNVTTPRLRARLASSLAASSSSRQANLGGAGYQ